MLESGIFSFWRMWMNIEQTKVWDKHSGQTLDCFCKGIEFTQSHPPEEFIPDSYDKCEPGLTLTLNHRWPKLTSGF